MGQSAEVTTFRPRMETEADFLAIRAWAKKHGRPFAAILNSYLPAIAYALQNQTFEHKGELYVSSDFGDVQLMRREAYAKDNKIININTRQ